MSDPRTLAEEQGKPGKFNFLDRLRGRNYPQETVEIYLDEELGYRLMSLEEKIANTTNKDVLAKLEAELQEVRAELEPQKYTILMRGVSNKAYDDLRKQAYEAYPPEVEEIKNPFTGEVSKQELDSEERDTLFTNLLWQALMVNITDPQGNTDDEIDLNLIASLRAEAPVDALRRISETVATLRMAVTWMDHLQGEDFFPKP